MMLNPKRPVCHLLLLTALLFCTYSAFAQTAPTDPAEMAQVKKLIKSLPEVKAMDQVFDSVSNRRQRVKMRIFPPEGARLLYKVEVGYQGSNRFEPHFYFYVAPENGRIWLEDLEYGDRPSLSEWRKRRQSTLHSPENSATTPTRERDTTLLPEKPEAELIYH